MMTMLLERLLHSNSLQLPHMSLWIPIDHPKPLMGVPIKIKDIDVDALIDNAATLNFISKEFVGKHELQKCCRKAPKVVVRVATSQRICSTKIFARRRGCEGCVRGSGPTTISIRRRYEGRGSPAPPEARGHARALQARQASLRRQIREPSQVRHMRVAGLDDATLLLPKTYLSSIINIQNTHHCE